MEVYSGVTVDTLPKRNGSIEYLDPEIAGHGTKVLLSDGSEGTYNPPPAKLVIPAGLNP